MQMLNKFQLHIKYINQTAWLRCKTHDHFPANNEPGKCNEDFKIHQTVRHFRHKYIFLLLTSLLNGIIFKNIICLICQLHVKIKS